MGKGGRNTEEQTQTQQDAQAAPTQSSCADKEARFMQALQRMMGDTELTEENIRDAMQNLTPEQRHELLSEGKELKQELLTNKDHAEERNLYFKEFNQRAEEAGMPIDQDGTYLAKKVTSYMATTNEQMPSLIILEAISSCPFLIKAALAEARGEPGASESDLSEIEAALGLLKVPGWREAEAEGRPPFVRRNLLLLHAHLHRERLGALSLSELTRQASNDVVAKARRLLDMIFSYSLQCGWVKATLTITELQALLVNGLWDHEDDECITSMKHKLTTVGLKMPKIGLRCVASDVGPGEKVRLKVTVSRSHAHSPTEMEAYRQLQRDEAAQQQQVKAQLAEAGGEDLPDITAEEEAEAKEGWWLMVESIRALPIAKVQGIEQSNISHNNLAGKPLGLAPSLDEASVTAEVEFNAPATPGEYKVIVHVRSASMCGVDAKRKVAFMVHAQKAKRSAPSTSSGTSTEPGEGMEDEALQEGAMTAEELKALEAEELKKKQESERKKAAEQEERDAKNAARDAEIAAKGKRAAGGVHKFDPDEVDVHGGNATADDFMDAFGF